jgi:hypothetical protein
MAVHNGAVDRELRTGAGHVDYFGLLRACQHGSSFLEGKVIANASSTGLLNSQSIEALIALGRGSQNGGRAIRDENGLDLGPVDKIG